MLTIAQPKALESESIQPLAVNSREAAKLLGVSEKTIFNLTKAGKISCKKIGWRSLYPVVSLKAFLETPGDE